MTWVQNIVAGVQLPLTLGLCAEQKLQLYTVVLIVFALSHSLNRSSGGSETMDQTPDSSKPIYTWTGPIFSMLPSIHQQVKPETRLAIHRTAACVPRGRPSKTPSIHNIHMTVLLVPRALTNRLDPKNQSLSPTSFGVPNG